MITKIINKVAFSRRVRQIKRYASHAAEIQQEQLEALGVDPDDMDTEMVLVMAMFLNAAQGDTKAFDRVIQILGKDIAHEELALKKRELKLKEKASSEGDSAALSKLDEVLGKIEGGF